MGKSKQSLADEIKSQIFDLEMAALDEAWESDNNYDMNEIFDEAEIKKAKLEEKLSDISLLKSKTHLNLL